MVDRDLHARHELANALLVVDVEEAGRNGQVASRIRDFISEHTDDYKVIVGTKHAEGARFHPDLQAIPDTIWPYSPENVDFDSVFVSDGYQSPWERGAPANNHGETVYDYLTRHGIARVDVVGVGVAPFSFETSSLGFATTVIAQLCTSSICELADFYQHNVQVESWENHDNLGNGG